MVLVLANMGLPMLFPQVILMAIALVPVVIIESVIARRRISIPLVKLLTDIGLANLCTTLIGVPLAWALMLGVDIMTTGGQMLDLDSPAQMLAAVTLGGAWLGPYSEHLDWMIPAVATVLLLPCFVVSVLIEHWVLVRRWRDQQRHQILAIVWRANVGSYFILFVLGIQWLSSSAS